MQPDQQFRLKSSLALATLNTVHRVRVLVMQYTQYCSRLAEEIDFSMQLIHTTWKNDRLDQESQVLGALRICMTTWLLVKGRTKPNKCMQHYALVRRVGIFFVLTECFIFFQLFTVLVVSRQV